jgi:hypothetical protein
MKKLLFALLIFTSFSTLAQFTHSGRGMYVDHFFNTTVNSSGNTIVNANLSILSIPAKEDQLLRYAQQNHITYLVLYDLHRVFGNSTYENYLCSFIEKAKTQFCIEKIGVASSCSAMFDNIYEVTPTPAISFPGPDSLTLQQSLAITQREVLPGDPLFYLSEVTKMSARAARFNDICNYKIDVLVT